MLPNALVESVKRGVADLERNNRAWNACRSGFAASLQDWQSEVEMPREKKSLFPVRVDAAAEEYDTRERIISKGNGTILSLRGLLKEAHQCVAELLNALDCNIASVITEPIPISSERTVLLEELTTKLHDYLYSHEQDLMLMNTIVNGISHPMSETTAQTL
ncbi:hypothetical protein WA577_000998, partial [Blastocystis sp. JDR]